jgi:UBX domain-containing protein 7
MANMPWDAARDQGKDDQKWLMVNIQDPGVFDCHVLNRDYFKNEQVKEIIKENFLFMQYNKDDAGASQYIQFYFRNHESQAAYPHIAVVDPRTGEQVKVWSGAPIPAVNIFIQDLIDFLTRYSLKDDARNPVATRKAEQPKVIDVDRMTEDEMLEMALQASLAGNGETGVNDTDPDHLTKVDPLDKGKQKAVGESAQLVDLTESANGTPTPPSAFARIASTSPHTEPENGPSTTRIQFRYSGGRVIRRFLLQDKVRRIYEWLKAAPFEDRAGVEFELKSMGSDLIAKLDDSIEEAGLKQGTVMVEFLED